MLRFDYLYEYASFVKQEKEVLKEWATDGGPKMMAHFGGWLYSLVYFGVWCGIQNSLFLSCPNRITQP